MGPEDGALCDSCACMHRLECASDGTPECGTAAVERCACRGGGLLGWMDLEHDLECVVSPSSFVSRNV